MNGLLDSPELAKALGINVESAREKAFTQGLLSSIFQAAALSGPQARPISTAQALGQVGLSGMGAYESSFDKTLQNALTGLKVRSAISEMNTPKYEKIKTADGGEMLIQIPKAGGTPSPVSIPGTGGPKPIDFDAQTQAFIRNVFGKPFDQLSVEQQRDVIAFAQAPDERQFSDLAIKRIEALRDQPQSTVLPLPKSRTQILQEILQRGDSNAPVVAPQTAPTVAPVTPPPTATPTAKPTSDVAPEVTTSMIKTSSNINLPVSISNTPLPTNQVPLINSAGITPKQKAELEIAQPKMIGSTEAVLNTTRQIRNSIREVLENPNFNLAFGFGGETTSKIYTPAADVRAMLDKIRNQFFAQGIVDLRSMSETGAGVGNVTEAEGKRFENLKASLAQFQSAEQARKELLRVEKELADSERRIENTFGRVYGPRTFDVTPLYQPAAKGSLKDILFPGSK